MPDPARLSSHRGLKCDAVAAYPRQAALARAHGITGLFALALIGLPAAAEAASSVIFETDGIRATAYADCDADAYTLVSLTDAGAAERYAASDKFGAKIEADLPAIVSASASWLDGDGAASCDSAIPVETIVVVGVVNALPIYASAASRAADWKVGSATPDPRAISSFALVLPRPEMMRCQGYEATVGARIGKHRTQVFTIRAAHTTGQWSHMQALTRLVPLHQELMAMVGQWGFAWHCADIFELASVAILADQERAALLKWNEEKILARAAEASGPDELGAIMAETYRTRELPPVSTLHDIVNLSNIGPPIRYGGFRSPQVERMEAAFGG